MLTPSMTVPVCLQQARYRNEMIPGQYVRVYGHLSRVDNRLHIKAYNLKPVRAFDEVRSRVSQRLR